MNDSQAAIAGAVSTTLPMSQPAGGAPQPASAKAAPQASASASDLHTVIRTCSRQPDTTPPQASIQSQSAVCQARQPGVALSPSSLLSSSSSDPPHPAATRHTDPANAQPNSLPTLFTLPSDPPTTGEEDKLSSRAWSSAVGAFARRAPRPSDR